MPFGDVTLTSSSAKDSIAQFNKNSQDLIVGVNERLTEGGSPLLCNNPLATALSLGIGFVSTHRNCSWIIFSLYNKSREVQVPKAQIEFHEALARYSPISSTDLLARSTSLFQKPLLNPKVQAAFPLT